MQSVNDYLKERMDEVKAHVTEKCNDLKIVVEGDTYFTVENEDGYRAYVQIELMEGFKFSTVHLPNRKTGSGWRVNELPSCDANTAVVVDTLKKTLGESIYNILSGKEKKDTRKPHENRKYFR